MKVPALSGDTRSIKTIVVPEGTSPMFITLPLISYVEDCTAKSAKRPSVVMYAPCAVDSVGLLIVKLTLIGVFILIWLGAETLRMSAGVGVGVGVAVGDGVSVGDGDVEAVGDGEGEIVGVGEAVGFGSAMLVSVLAKK